MEKPSRTVIEVKQVKKELWRKALKKSNGTLKDAGNIYDKMCSFP